MRDFDVVPKGFYVFSIDFGPFSLMDRYHAMERHVFLGLPQFPPMAWLVRGGFEGGTEWSDARLLHSVGT
jgi:hypothetical protein